MQYKGKYTENITWTTNKNKIFLYFTAVKCNLIQLSQFRIHNYLKAWATLSDEGKMDSVQICFISLDAIYYGYILLYSSYKKKKLQGDILLFSTGKNDADALLKLSIEGSMPGCIPLVPLQCLNRNWCLRG